MHLFSSFFLSIAPSYHHAYMSVSSTVVHPLTPHFYIVKLGFTGVYIIFIFLLENIDCGYSQLMV